MSRVIHFEIYAEDVPRAVAFYQAVFDWTTDDWSDHAGMPYFGGTTGTEDEPGINGAIMQRQGPNPAPGAPVQGEVVDQAEQPVETGRLARRDEVVEGALGRR